MAYKAKAVAGLLAATCVFSIIALILSVVNVKDVFLPPSTKVGSLGGAQLPTLTWVLAAPWYRIYPRFQAGCLSLTWEQTPAQAAMPGGSGRVSSL